MSSLTGAAKDPAELMEEAEQLRQIEAARRIFRLPESQWEGKINLLPKDERSEVRRCLTILKQHTPVRAVCTRGFADE